jgi:hypothetical protein
VVLDIDYDTNGNDTVAKLNRGGSIINFQAFGEESKLTDGNGNQKTFTHNADGINAIYEVNDYDEVWYESITSTFKESLSPLSYYEKTGKAKKLFCFI